ncbi:restriction endonuclease subunit S [Leifsonia sp. Root227]|uniref:restriction endonuclease subunit S n=1 Tax=Leifsonia sp. Root227 TaxID=1736496 RepID=UPI0009EA50D7|nr:restriction endonuclease subunit S [Leifsonia sp. Root227]
MTAELGGASALGDRIVDLFPPDWSRSPFWSVYRRVKRVSSGNEVLLSVYRDHGVVRKSDRDDNFNKASDDLSLYQRVSKNDLVINKMKAWQGSVAISTLDGIVSPAYFVFEETSVTDPTFMHYLLRSDPYVAAYRAASKGIRPNQWDLDPDVLRVLPLCLPSVDKQSEIARFLDCETAEIDAFIREQEELIALLRERRAASISHAVTKGLDPKAFMKDSGVAWIGEVPVKWDCIPLKWIARLKTGGTPKTPEGFSGEPGFPWIRPEDLDTSGAESIASRWISAVGAAELRQANAGATLLCAIGASLGKAGYSKQPVYTNQQITAVEARGNPRYVYYMLVAARESIVSLSVGNTMPIINNDRLGSLVVPVPPLQEQDEIARELDFGMDEINRAIVDAEKAVALSRERRSALISAAVTGKIRARNKGE